MTQQEIQELAGHRQVPAWVMKLVGDCLAKEREQKPVAWRHDMGEENGGWEYFEEASCKGCQPLYTHPQPKQPLTDEQIDELLGGYYISHWGNIRYEYHRSIARAIEAAHGIKGEA